MASLRFRLVVGEQQTAGYSIQGKRRIYTRLCLKDVVWAKTTHNSIHVEYCVLPCPNVYFLALWLLFGCGEVVAEVVPQT